MDVFKKKVIDTWGEQGQIWLNSIPTILHRLERHWRISQIVPYSNLSYNYVAHAIQQDGCEVVIKLSCDKGLIENEQRALNHFKGSGSIQLIDYLQQENALLLQKAVPGTLLNQAVDLSMEDKIDAYAKVVNSISALPFNDQHYPHVTSWCEAIDRIVDPIFTTDLVSKARTIKNNLLNSIKHPCLCHGDLHQQNIVLHEAQWLSIDPKGIIGEVAFEAAAFDILTQEEIAGGKNQTSVIKHRVKLLATRLNIDVESLLDWLFIRIMISAQWSIEDNADPANMLHLAKWVLPLIGTVHTS
jgi:streptomycin 6-kinase